MPRADPRHSFGQFQRGTSGQFETGNGGIKLHENSDGCTANAWKIRPYSFSCAAGQNAGVRSGDRQSNG
jgi:hypothetical protein